MPKLFDLTIKTPEKLVHTGKAQYLKVMSDEAMLKILPGHASLTTTLSYSPLIFKDDEGNEESYIAKRGLLSVSFDLNQVTLMVLDCQKKSEISPTSAKEYLEFIKQELAAGKDLSEFKIKFYEDEQYVLERQLKDLPAEDEE